MSHILISIKYSVFPAEGHKKVKVFFVKINIGSCMKAISINYNLVFIEFKYFT